MDIREKFSELSTPKKIAVVGGAGLVGFFLIRKLLGGASSGGSTVSASDYTQSLGSLGGSSSDEAGASGLQSQIDSLYNAIDQLTTAVSDTQSTTAEAIQTLTTTTETAQNETSFSSALMSTPSIYSDTLDDASQYKSVLSNLTEAVSGGDITSDQAAKASTYLAGYGNNGAAVPGATYSTLEQIKADANLKAAEIARTTTVIQNRTAAGMDTTNQTAWLNMLNGKTA
jgi:hypothetical protein